MNSVDSTLTSDLERQTRNSINVELTTISRLLEELQSLLNQAQPINNWEEVLSTSSESKRKYTRDATIGNFYDNDDNKTLRVKLLLLSLTTPIIQTTALLYHSINRLIKLVTFYEFFNNKNSWTSAVKKYAQNLAILVCGPLILVGMQLTAMLGVITPMQDGPKDARKMYALGETILFGYNGWRLAECFKPKAKERFSKYKITIINPQNRLEQLQKLDVSKTDLHFRKTIKN